VFGRDDVAVVTGVGPGMGRSIALGFAHRGVDVVLAARSGERLRRAPPRRSLSTGLRPHGRDRLVEDFSSEPVENGPTRSWTGQRNDLEPRSQRVDPRRMHPCAT